MFTHCETMETIVFNHSCQWLSYGANDSDIMHDPHFCCECSAVFLLTGTIHTFASLCNGTTKSMGGLCSTKRRLMWSTCSSTQSNACRYAGLTNHAKCGKEGCGGLFYAAWKSTKKSFAMKNGLSIKGSARTHSIGDQLQDSSITRARELQICDAASRSQCCKI